MLLGPFCLSFPSCPLLHLFFLPQLSLNLPSASYSTSVTSLGGMQYPGAMGSM